VTVRTKADLSRKIHRDLVLELIQVLELVLHLLLLLQLQAVDWLDLHHLGCITLLYLHLLILRL
jgi:hypothetical protein